MQSFFAKLIFALLLAGSCAAASPALAATEQALGGRASFNWSGYSASGSKYTAVGATWVVPETLAVSSSSISTDAAWVGIGGIRREDLVQAGTQALSRNGRITYQAWYELLPEYQQIIPLKVQGGDQVRVSLFELVPGLWHLSFLNSTTGGEYEKTLEYDSSYTSAEWIEEMPTITTTAGAPVYAPLAEFGSVTFTDAYAVQKGIRKDLSALRPSPITMVSKENHSIRLATPSVLDGNSFTVTRSSAKPSPASPDSKNSTQQLIIWSK